MTTLTVAEPAAAVNDEIAYMNALADGMMRYAAGEPLGNCRNDAEREGWQQARRRDVESHYQGMSAYIKAMAAEGLDEEAADYLSVEHANWWMY